MIATFRGRSASSVTMTRYACRATRDDRLVASTLVHKAINTLRCGVIDEVGARLEIF
jgi:hypothetical protein